MTRKFTHILFAACIAIIGLPALTFAEISFSVSPIRIELSGEVGGTHTDVMEVRNEGNEKARIKITMQDWLLSEEGTPSFQKAGSLQRSCTGWMKINPVDFLLQPGEKKIVRYSVSIPDGVKNGGYRGAFMFETVPQVEPGQKTKAVAIKGNIAAVMYLVVGKTDPVGDLTDMSYNDSKKERQVLTRIKNSGDIHFRIKGSIKITDEAGKTVQTADLPDVPILPESVRTIPVTLDEKLPAGKYTAVATVDIGAKALLVGELPFVVK
jgi:P pilus assembly chaperone PapD